MENSINFIKKYVKNLTYHEPKALASVIDISYRYWDLYKSAPNSKKCLTLLKDWDIFKKSMWLYVQNYDAIITPVCTIPAHKHGETPVEAFPYTLTYSLVGWPCAVVRIGTSSDGFPINAQIIAKPFHEEICLLLAKQLEHVCGWQEPNL